MRPATSQRRQTSQASQTRPGSNGGVTCSTIAPNPGEALQRLFATGEHAGLHRQVPVEVGEPPDAHARVAGRRSRDRVGGADVAVERQRRARIETRLHVQQPREVEHRARHRAAGRQLRDVGIDDRPVRHAALARPHAEDVVPARGIAQAPHEVAAVGDGEHARRERDRGSAAAAAGGARRVVGVHRRAEHLVERVRAQAELRRVRLADDDRAGRLHPLHHQVVVRGHEVREERRAQRRAQARRGGHVLDRLRQPVHPSAPSPGREVGVALAGFAQQVVGIAKADDRVVARIRALDPRERRLHQLATRERLRRDAPRQVLGGEIGEFAHQPGRLRIQSAVPRNASINGGTSSGGAATSSSAMRMHASQASRSALAIANGRCRARSIGWPKRSV